MTSAQTPINDFHTVEVDYIVRDVGSSLVGLVAYEIESSTLYIDLNDRVYKYSEVPASVFNALVGADSPGHYYGENVRGKYTSQFFDYTQDFEFEVTPWTAPAPEAPEVRTLDQGLNRDNSYLVTYLETETVVTKVEHPREVRVYANTIEDAIERASEMIDLDEIEAILTSIKVDLTVSLV